MDPWKGSGRKVGPHQYLLVHLAFVCDGKFAFRRWFHGMMDKHPPWFFLERVVLKCKYNMVNWPSVYRYKSRAGLGILNTKLMNVAMNLVGEDHEG
jgi:hypothetical protein